MAIKHALVWLDHHEAKVFFLHDDSFEEKHVKAPHAHVFDKHHPADAAHFFRDTWNAVKDCTEILLVGPGNTKNELKRHVEAHDRRGAARIVAVETLDHPTDRELVAIARKQFAKIDRMLGTAP